jgi:transposase
MARKAHPTDVSDDAWAVVAPSVPLMTAEAPQRDQSVRAVFHDLRWMVRAGAVWRLMPHDVPPWHTVYQPRHRWLKAGVFATMGHELRTVLRLAAGRTAEPSAAIFDSRMRPSTRASGPRAGDDGATRRRGSKGPLAVERLGYLWAAHVTAASEQDRSQVSALAAKVHEVTGDAVALACVDQGRGLKQPRTRRCTICRSQW